MSGKTYGNQFKCMVTRSNHAFKASSHSETHQHHSQMTESDLNLIYIKSLSENQKNLKKWQGIR